MMITRREFTKVAAVGVVSPLLLKDAVAKEVAKEKFHHLEKGKKLFYLMENGSIYSIEARGCDIKITSSCKNSFRVIRNQKFDGSEGESFYDFHAERNGCHSTDATHFGIINDVHQPIWSVSEINSAAPRHLYLEHGR